MKLAAQLAEAPLEIGRLDRQLPRQTEEREVVAMTAQRENAAALRTEVLVDRSPRAAAAALERRYGLDWYRVGSHGNRICLSGRSATRRWRRRITRRRSCRSRTSA